MKTFEIAFGNSYPHYYTLKGVDAICPPEQTFLTGVATITGAYNDDNPVSIGDVLIISKIEHEVVSLETYPTKGKHTKPSTAFTCTAYYKRNKPNV